MPFAAGEEIFFSRCLLFGNRLSNGARKIDMEQVADRSMHIDAILFKVHTDAGTLVSHGFLKTRALARIQRPSLPADQRLAPLRRLRNVGKDPSRTGRCSRAGRNSLECFASRVPVCCLQVRMRFCVASLCEQRQVFRPYEQCKRQSAYIRDTPGLDTTGRGMVRMQPNTRNANPPFGLSELRRVLLNTP
jgi:hypothetical protein